MLLLKKDVSGRAFLLQFIQLMNEFGPVIPWLKPLNHLSFCTNGRHFEREIYRTIGCDPGTILPYQFLTSGMDREFFGGVLHFEQSPERFTDPDLKYMQSTLEATGASYITCLHVRNVKRGEGWGAEIVRRSVRKVLEVHPVLWGVCEPELSAWYEKLGASVLNAGDNSEHLAVISWRR
ncbi:MAG: hypothetical protein JWN37_890 [Candidatus Nomurabacteria bacterium]|nr:hypothetical protein [Candidatus Nomurabacteria bacterium]